MRHVLLTLASSLFLVGPAAADDKPATRVYENRLTPLKDPPPLLGDHPEYVEPIRTGPRFEAPMRIDDPGADLEVRAWRFSYNVRGIVEVPNRLAAKATAIVVVHPWGVDDGLGWKSPEPAGVAFHCTPFKNALTLKHMRDVINPFLKAGRGRAGVVAYSLPGTADPIRKKMYRSPGYLPSAQERLQGAKELAIKLGEFKYEGEPLGSILPFTARHIYAHSQACIDFVDQTVGGLAVRSDSPYIDDCPATTRRLVRWPTKR